jgi:hypothetical protein
MATRGKFDEFGQPLVVNMGEFITRAYIGDGYFVNFADASPRPHHSPMLVYRFGNAVGSEAMMAMAAYLAAQADFENSVPEGRSLMRNLPELFHTRELLEVKAVEPLLADSWLPDIQVMFSRDQAGSTQGLYLAAKAGHNEESHNHNDVGSFLVFKNGRPAIIDIGGATYTRDYGSEWVRESAYHNLAPVIDGKVQLKGRKYSARNVSFERPAGEVVFSQDFAPAYGEESGIKKWERIYRHSKGRSIAISDRYELSEQPAAISLPMIFQSRPDISSPGQVLIEPAEDTRLTIAYDPDLFDIEFEKITVEDRSVAGKWGDTLYRLNFVMREPAMSGEFRFLIE